MGILKKTYPLLIAFILTGCYEDFTPEIDTKPVLCLNSLITAGEPIDVSVTRTWLYTDENGTRMHDVDDAEVRIYADGELVGEDYIAREGDRIKIIAESPSYGRAEAEVDIPYSVPVGSLTWNAVVTDSLDWVDTNMTTYVYRINLNAKMTINAPPGVDNYYQFSYKGFPEEDKSDPDVTIYRPMTFSPGTFIYESEPIFSEHIGELDAITGSESFGFTFFTDRQFPGKTYTLNIRFDDMDYNLRKGGNIDENCDLFDCGLILTLNTVSLSYYNWCNYCWNDLNGTIGDLSEIGMCDPIWGYSNVSTGAGVVAALSRSSCTINLRDFLKNKIKPSTPRQ